MNYKVAILVIFVLLASLVMWLIFSEKSWGLFVMAVAVPVLVVVQVIIILRAKGDRKPKETDGMYEND